MPQGRPGGNQSRWRSSPFRAGVGNGRGSDGRAIAPPGGRDGPDRPCQGAAPASLLAARAPGWFFTPRTVTVIVEHSPSMVRCSSSPSCTAKVCSPGGIRLSKTAEPSPKWDPRGRLGDDLAGRQALGGDADVEVSDPPSGRLDLFGDRQQREALAAELETGPGSTRSPRRPATRRTRAAPPGPDRPSTRPPAPPPRPAPPLRALSSCVPACSTPAP